MVLPNSNFNPTIPIPNNPFYAPETYLVQGAYNNLIVGQNLFVDQTGNLSATPGGPIGTVFSVGVGTGLVTSLPGNAPITGSGGISLANFGPGAGTTNYPSSITLDVKGRVAGITAGNIPVTSVGAGTGLCTNLPGNAPITTIGNISLCALNPNPTGTYNYSTVTVNAYGQVTGAVSGTTPVLSINGTLPITVAPGVNPTVSVNAATPSTCGVVHGCTAATSTALGTGAGSGANFVASGNNVALGVNANVAAWTGTQLAIGTNNGNWITGCNDLSIKPGYGIRDFSDSLGAINSNLKSCNGNLVWSDVGATVSKVAGPLSNVYFSPSSNWSVEWSPTGTVAQPGAGLFFIPNVPLYVAWSSYTNGGSTTHYTANTLISSSQKFLVFGGGLNVGATQYVNLTINDAAGNIQQGYQITLQYAVNGITGPGSQNLFSITKLY